ncbi:hypothetical protein GUI51_02025 [Enterococcus mundtii]|uniref:hypothetical protein n=1 Tax=Enterococcus mundtii TaxID=53346 RepID=UPI00101ED081|nr:hypothetical protein [Enterococcus mundtii]MZZ57653.1 hypothetical protein [Enterococcus mundtii]MZZ60628.1 hypothetical protein [Enterococcus mundtii]MZZ67613.1 hypothetical protein [Enterococcus mundtii]MZZ96464.1 hypothetical protein [Enterococcus mundtii]MZZ99438.1 hypothetical protein [Enterococcus mundtii]
MLDMRIEDYRITTTSDCKNIVLSRVVRDESGKIQYTESAKGAQEEATSFVGYYQTLTMCLRAIQRDYVMREGRVIKSIIEYKKALERIARHFESECEIEGVTNK